MFDSITQEKFDKLSKADKNRFNNLLNEYNEMNTPTIQRLGFNDPSIEVTRNERFMKLVNAIESIKKGRFAQ